MSKRKAKIDWLHEPLSKDEVDRILRVMRLHMAMASCGMTDASTTVPIKLLLRLMVQAGIRIGLP